MSLASILVLVAANASLALNPDSAYLVMSAVVTDEDARQPTYVALYTGSYPYYIHVPVSESIVEIRPDIYRVGHVDFGESADDSEGTITFRKDFRIEVEKGYIYFLGRMELGRVNKRRHKLVFVPDEPLLRRACAKAPDIFQSLPVVLVSGKEVVVDCAGDSSPDSN